MVFSGRKRSATGRILKPHGKRGLLRFNFSGKIWSKLAVPSMTRGAPYRLDILEKKGLTQQAGLAFQPGRPRSISSQNFLDNGTRGDVSWTR